MTSHRSSLLVLVAVVLISTFVFAADPPARVARLNYISGQVSLQPGGVNEWVAGNINRPLTTADRVWTDKDSRAELQMGAASARLNGETSLTLANVSDNAAQLQLDQGTLNLHVVRLFEGEVYEIDTPNLAFTVEKAGDYRFDVDNAGDTTVVTVWKGKGEATGDNPGIRIGSNQQFTFSGGRSLRSVVTNAPGFDGFDSWCRVRAEREDKSPSLRYVSPHSVGYSDLDEYGRWQEVSPYGAVWVPTTVAAGWAPYRWGHWVFIAPWGWTWVDDAPWGFAPFHYGRWVHFGGYWGWSPGPIYARPIYAPALVGWIGGSHWGVGLSFGVGGGMGWFPLGWGEPYIPYYNHSRGYFQNVNVSNTHITNITYITNNYYGGHNTRPIRYVNQHVPDAVTAVPNATFTGSRPTRPVVVPVTATTLSGATVINTVPIRPTRDSMLGSTQHTTVPPGLSSRPVVTRMTPPARAAEERGVELSRPGRSSMTTPIGASGAVANESPNRSSRAIPRPSSGGAPTVAVEETPRNTPHPPDVGTVNRAIPGAMPARVPRPSPATSMTMREPETSHTTVIATPTTTPSRVPRPSPGVTPAPATQERITNERPTREAPTVSREIARPTTNATPTPNITRAERPVVRSTETRSTPSTAPPTPIQQSAPTPHASEPSRQSRPEKTVDKDKAGPHSGLRYPSPYSEVMRTVSYTQPAVPRPSGPVAAAPRSNYQMSYSGARTFAPPSRATYATHTPTSYAQSSRSAEPASVAHSARTTEQSAPRASGNPGNHGRGK